MNVVQFTDLREDTERLGIRTVLHSFVPEISPFDQRTWPKPVGAHFVDARIRLAVGFRSWLRNPKVRKRQADLIRALNDMLIQFVLVDIRTLVIADEAIEMSEVFVHPNVNVLILNLANVHLPRARMDETGGSGPVNLLGCIVTVVRFVVVHGTWLHSVMLQFEDMFVVGQRIRMGIFGLLDGFSRKGIEERTRDSFSPSRVARAQAYYNLPRDRSCIDIVRAR